MKITTLESSGEKQLLCIRLAGVKLRKLRGGSSLAYNTVNLRISICIILRRLWSLSAVSMIYLCVWISGSLPLPAAGGRSQFVPTGGRVQVELLPWPCHSTRSSPATGVLSDPLVWGSELSLCSLPPLFCCSSRKGTPRAASKASRTDVTPPSVDPARVTH